MTLRPSILVSVLLAALVTGCGGGGGGGGPTAPPTQIDVNESEPNDFTAQSVGTLSLDIVVSGATSSNRDVDLYLVKAGSVTTLFVNLDWNSAADLELAISDTVGIFVRNVDTAGHPESCKLPNLPAGNYTVRVGSFTNAATNYTLTLGKR